MRYFHFISSLCFILLCTTPNHITLEASPKTDYLTTQFFEHEWLAKYFNACNEDSSPLEMIDFLLVIKKNLTDKGCATPNLGTTCLALRAFLSEKANCPNEEVFNYLYELLEMREQELHSTSNDLSFKTKALPFLLTKNKKKSHQFASDKELPGNMVLGLCKVLAGSLCCIIPHGVAQTFGGALIASGLYDIGVECKELDEKNKKYQEEFGPPKPPPNFPPRFFR